MSELSVIFRRIMNENERHERNEEMASIDTLLFEAMPVHYEYEHYQSNAYSQFHDSNNVYMHLIHKLKAKVEDCEAQSIDHTETDKENESDESDEYSRVYHEYNSNVNHLKKLIQTQYEKVKASEDAYTHNVKLHKQLTQSLTDFGNIHISTQNEKILESQSTFHNVLHTYITHIEEDTQLEKLHNAYLNELKLFQKYVTMANLCNDVQQIPLCILCMESVPSIAFQCGHVCCDTCVVKLNTCHTCRGPVENKIKLFLYN